MQSGTVFTQADGKQKDGRHPADAAFPVLGQDSFSCASLHEPIFGTLMDR